MSAIASDSFAVDHLVIATSSLVEGSLYLREKLGVDLDAGGIHPGVGTHNCLLRIGGGSYLELIAPDPQQSEPAALRPFGLDDPTMQERLAVRPRLVHFVIRVVDFDSAVRALDYSPGPPRPMRRGELSWTLAIGKHPAGAAANPLPAMINWGEHCPPGQTLPTRGVTLDRLHVFGGGSVVQCLEPLAEDRRVQLHRDRQPMLAAEFQTPRGWAILD